MTRALIQNVLGAALPTSSHGDGVWLWDTAGRQYLDGCAGAVVSALGHAHPDVLAAMRHQAERVTFTHRGAFSSAPLEEMADRLTAMTGYPGAWFVGSGSEAVEAAMQFALQYHREVGSPQRTVFLSARRGYHGNTLGALSASGHARRQGITGIALEIPLLPTPYAYRDQGERSETAYTRALLDDARDVFEAHAEHLAGVLIEPVGGATLAATVPPAGYLAGLKSLCEEFGALFIADEVMSGMGRTGSVLAAQADGVQADLVAMGKGLGAGYTPIAATLVSERVLAAIESGSGRILGGHTYAGNPLSASVGAAVLAVIERDALVQRAAETGTLLVAGLTGIASRHPLIGDVRGRGMLLGVEFVQDADSKGVTLPQGTIAGQIFTRCMHHGLVVYPTTGGFIDAVQIAPPLTISVDELAELLRRFELAVSDVENALVAAGHIGADHSAAGHSAADDIAAETIRAEIEEHA